MTIEQVKAYISSRGWSMKDGRYGDVSQIVELKGKDYPAGFHIVIIKQISGNKIVDHSTGKIIGYIKEPD